MNSIASIDNVTEHVIVYTDDDTALIVTGKDWEELKKNPPNLTKNTIMIEP